MGLVYDGDAMEAMDRPDLAESNRRPLWIDARVALQTPRNKHQVERTPIPPPPRRADGTRVENDGISLSYPEDSTGPTSLHPHPNFKPFLFFTLESSKLLLILLLNKAFVIVGSNWFTRYPNR
ncbi:hypothetical protein GEV33_002035 [Tenebrio molitor]|uniref:Uncharacterized protein n=1 Tax=Tenebrio molitor TaxID=7067 RepID=A0A8J6HS72_TENMO|nr:hypothetical protein GEV33_002035 [Tenebrio molitor]